MGQRFFNSGADRAADGGEVLSFHGEYSDFGWEVELELAGEGPARRVGPARDENAKPSGIRPSN